MKWVHTPSLIYSTTQRHPRDDSGHELITCTKPIDAVNTAISLNRRCIVCSEANLQFATHVLSSSAECVAGVQKCLKQPMYMYK